MNRTLLGTLIILTSCLSGCGDQNNQTASRQPETLPPQRADVKTVVQGQSKAAAELQQNFQQTAGDLAKKAQTLLAQAQQYLDEGKLDEAISMAQNVLSFDPKNMDAQKIIDTAKAKLKAMAEQKATDIKSGLMNSLGTTGQ